MESLFAMLSLDSLKDADLFYINKNSIRHSNVLRETGEVVATRFRGILNLSMRHERNNKLTRLFWRSDNDNHRLCNNSLCFLKSSIFCRFLKEDNPSAVTTKAAALNRNLWILISITFINIANHKYSMAYTVK